MIPVFISLFYFSSETISLHNKHLFTMLLFVFAGITDWLDGYLARRLNQYSAFGAFLDPVADKLMVTAALILLVSQDIVDPVIAFIIIGREIAISALREWMAHLGDSKSTAVSMIGKVKTTFQLVAIPFLLYQEPLLGLPILKIGEILIYVAALLTLWSMAYYLTMAMPRIGRGKRG